MTYRLLCYVIATVQLVLGGLYLFAPGQMALWQGLSPLPADAGYPLAMLAARFLVYGVGMIAIARAPEKNRGWARGMIAIQLIDLGAGLAYTAAGIVPLAASAFPMLNATLFAALLWLFEPGRAGRNPDAQAA